MLRGRGNFLAGMICVLCAVGAANTRAANEDVLAARVKSAFVFNFIRFTEWPGKAFASPKDPLVVGVVGSPTLVKEMEDTLRGKMVNERPIVVQQFQADHIGKCHVLYIAISNNSAGDALNKAPTENTLTIGDWDGFTAAGGIVRFFEEDGKERFEINVGAAGKAFLQISGKLLKLARTTNN